MTEPKRALEAFYYFVSQINRLLYNDELEEKEETQGEKLGDPSEGGEAASRQNCAGAIDGLPLK